MGGRVRREENGRKRYREAYSTHTSHMQKPTHTHTHKYTHMVHGRNNTKYRGHAIGCIGHVPHAGNNGHLHAPSCYVCRTVELGWRNKGD